MGPGFEQAFIGAASRSHVLALLPRVDLPIAAFGLHQVFRVDERVETLPVDETSMKLSVKGVVSVGHRTIAPSPRQLGVDDWRHDAS